MKKLLILLLFFLTFSMIKAQDGTIDLSFASNGYFTNTDPQKTITCYALGKQNAEKIIMAGSTNDNSDIDMLIIRLNKDGAIDSSFGDNGRVVVDFFGKSDIAKSLVVLPDNKIIIGGGAEDVSNINFAFLKLNEDGSIDSSFGNNGRVTLASTIGISKIGIQSSGKIVARGGATLIRLDSDGSIDLSFGVNGVLTCFNSTLMKIQKDDKILLARNDTTYIIRYLSEGALDMSFGVNGVYAVNSLTNNHTTNFHINFLDLDSSNRILYGGSASTMGGASIQTSPIIKRLFLNGSVDSSYDGSLDNSFFSNPTRILVQSNQKVILASSGGGTSLSSERYTVSRLYQTPPSYFNFFDTSFNRTGINKSLQVSSPNDVFTAEDMMLLDDSSFLVLGNMNSSNFNLIKYHTSPYDYIVLPPHADFSVNATTGMPNQSVFTFHDNSSNYPTNRKWSFSPSNISYQNSTSDTSRMPSLVFTVSGNYDVKLVVANSLGKDSVIKYDFIQIGDAPVTDFSVNSIVNDTTAFFRFYDSSLNQPTHWKWEITPAAYVVFVELTSDTVQNPVVKFSTPGFYSVKLKTANPYGIDSIIKINYITIVNPKKPVADFTQSMLDGQINDTISFIDMSTYSPASWIWTITPNTFSFVNGTDSSSQNPDVRFESTGKYTVKLYVANQFGVDSINKTDLIQIVLTGLSQIDQEATLSIYPNPVTDYLYINSTTNQDLYGYSIYDMMGREMLAGRNTQHKFKVDISTLKEGNYILVVKANDKTMYKHIQVKK